MATDLAKLVVRLEAQSSQLLTELEKANNRIDRFASKTGKTLQKWSNGLIAAFSARAIFQFSNDVLKAQAGLADMAQKTGVTVEELSALGYAAQQSGSDLQTLDAGLRGLSNTATDAANGSKKAADSFAVLGIKVRDGNDELKSSGDLLLEIAEQFAQYEDGAAKSALAQDLFGKAGRDLIPLLNKGAAGIEELTKRADELGITLSTQAAQAASKLQDNLATLGAITRGVVGQALQEVVPILSNFAEGMITGAEGSTALDGAVRVLAAGLKVLLSAGVIVGEIFDRIGSAIGNTAASIAAVLEGDFRRAFTIQTDYWKESGESIGAAADQLGKIWEDAGANVVAAAEDTDAKLKKTLSFGGNTSALEEVKVTAEKIDLSPMEQFYKDLEDLTKTSTEKQLESFYAQKAALDELAASQRITTTQYAARLEEINKVREDALGITQRQEEAEARLKKTMDEGRAVFEATRTPLEQYNAELVRLNNLLFQSAIDQDTYNRAVEQAQDAFDKATDGAAKFYEEAAENAQDILGQGIYDSIKSGFDKGAGEALDTFADMLLRMATEALAADIFGSIFKSDGTSSGGGTDWVQAGLGLFTSFFGGGRAQTGAVNPGVAYNVGENGPERFVPTVPGRIEDERRMGGNRNNIYVTVEAPKGSVSRQTQLQTGATIAKQIGMANRRNN